MGWFPGAPPSWFALHDVAPGREGPLTEQWQGHGRGTGRVAGAHPRQPLRGSSGLHLDLWMAPGEAVMQAQREIQVHHHLSGLDLGWGLYS